MSALISLSSVDGSACAPLVIVSPLFQKMRCDPIWPWRPGDGLLHPWSAVDAPAERGARCCRCLRWHGPSTPIGSAIELQMASMGIDSILAESTRPVGDSIDSL